MIVLTLFYSCSQFYLILVIFKKHILSSDLSRKIVDSVFLNFNFRHAYSSAYMKNIIRIILNTIKNASDYLLLVVFIILPYLGYIKKNIFRVICHAK